MLFILAIDIIDNGGRRSLKKVIAGALRPAATAALLHLHALQPFNPVNPTVNNDRTELQATILKKTCADLIQSIFIPFISSLSPTSITQHNYDSTNRCSSCR